MRIIDLKCPNCGAKLTRKKEDLLLCQACQSEFLLDSEKDNHYTIHNHYEAAPTTSAEKGTVPNLRVMKFVLITVVLMMLTLSALPILLSRDHEHTRSSAKITKKMSRKLPESADVQRLVAHIFNKNFAEVTSKELASIKYLKVTANDDEGWDFQYGFTEWQESVTDYDYQEFTLDQRTSLEILDLTSFKGLNFLDLNESHHINGSHDPFNLAGTKELRYYGHSANQPLNAILAALADNKELTHLTTQLRSDEERDALMKLSQLKGLSLTFIPKDVSLNELGALKKLEQLEVDYAERNELDWLTQFEHLKKLTLTNAETITDYASLESLPTIETLKIKDGDYLKELNFVKHMPNLTKLVIEWSPIQSIAPLEGHPTLEVLELANSPITDLTPLATLTNLKRLIIDDVATECLIAPLENLTQLEDVKVPDTFLALITNTPSVVTLAVEGWGGIDFADISALKNLEALSLSGVRMDLVNEEVLESLPRLTSLTLEDVTLDGSDGEGSGLFRQPHLEELILGKGARVSFNTTQAVTMPALKVLKITEPAYFYLYDGSDFQNFEMVGLTPFVTAFKELPQLEVLALPSAKLKSLAFVEKLPNLKELDLSDNYIGELEPLTALPHLISVNLQNNPVKNWEILSPDIQVMK